MRNKKGIYARASALGIQRMSPRLLACLPCFVCNPSFRKGKVQTRSIIKSIYTMFQCPGTKSATSLHGSHTGMVLLENNK